ncbi:response regulator of citrate/malate metabolism [Owenweeksia hongkongensis DSM 17368]|uniref:Response regulator of citrate/malate metabolism n=2 Tax=Owenweeksia TaxID=267986 RepID=G8R5P1_OWEHD|nr:response regulator of citrate/malate metabolism [Owenweeksia hongkongensis DSM 17368]
MGNCNVCIIDDDIVYQFTAKKFLEKISEVSKIMIFSNGLEASQHLHDKPTTAEDLPDIIFLDIRMPVMDGFTFLERFKTIKPNIAKPITIYMVSSSPESKDREKALAYSEVSEYLIKPLTFDIFKEKIYSFLN